MDLDLAKLSLHDVNRKIRKSAGNYVLKSSSSRAHVLVVGLKSGSVAIKGDAGDYVGALNDGCRIAIEGRAGRFLGDGMTSGEIIARGAGYGAGSYMYGGTIVIKGSAGDFLGQMNKGGTIVVDGSAGNEAGLYMLNGSIIVTADLGERAGNYLIHGTIYFGGKTKSLGSNAKISNLEADEIKELGSIFKKYSINADAKKFKKLVPESIRPFYGETPRQKAGGAPKTEAATGKTKQIQPQSDETNIRRGVSGEKK